METAVQISRESKRRPLSSNLEMERKDDAKLKEKRLKEKRRVIRINNAYKQLYAAMKLDGAKRKRISRNALIRATLEYITVQESRTDRVQSATTVAAVTAAAAHSSSTPSPRTPWPQFMSPDQLYVNHSQRCVVWPVTDWPQPPPCAPHVENGAITTPHCSWLTVPTPPPALPAIRQQPYRYVQGEWMTTPPQESSSGELYQPYTGDPRQAAEWPEIPRPSKMMTLNSCPWSRPPTPYHAN